MCKIFNFSFAALLVLAICSLSALAQSQSTGGQIVGTVKDPNGGLVRGATVTVTNTETNATQTLTTDDDGGFRAVSLQPGDYTVNVTAPGYGAVTQTGYKVEVGSALDANITLQVGDVNVEVNVTSAAVEITQTQTPTNINSTSISELPINGRRFTDFVLLTPTADVDPVRSQISLAGQRGINANVQIDGADYNNPFFGGYRGGERANQAFGFPQSGIREFQVITSGYNAEFGRSTGGIVNVVTKSGTNDFRGSAFYLLRPAKAAHKNVFGQVAAPTQHQYGGAVGGRIVENKAFWFFSVEQQKLNQERAVLFDRLRLVPPGSTGVQEAQAFYTGLEGPYTQTNDAFALLGRFDYTVNDRNSFNVRYNYGTNTAENAVTAGTSLQPTTDSALSNNGTEGNSQHTVVGQLTSFFSSRTINEFRGQYSRENRPREANEISPLVNSTFGSYGTVSFLPTTQYDYRVQISDSVSHNRSEHAFKFGGEFNYTFADQFFAFRQTGNFDFPGLSSDPVTQLRVLTVGSVASSDPANRFDVTASRYRRAIGNALADLDSTEIAFFAQDSWRIRPNLTLNYGLRYEAQFMPEPDTSNTALTDIVANAILPLGRVDPRDIPDQTNQFAPRLGFAWDPFNDAKGVIRGYAGLYYARTPLLTLAGPINNFRTVPGDVQLTLQGFTTTTPGTPCSSLANAGCPNTIYEMFQTIGINLNSFALGSLPILTPAQVLQIAQNVATARGQAFNPFSGLGLITVGEQLKNPRSMQFGLAFEREVRSGLTLGATFDYVNTVNLNRNRDIDLPPPVIRPNDLSRRPFFGIGSAAAFQTTQNRPITQLGNAGFLQIREASARSLYRALTLRAQLRRKVGQFDVFYTLSRNLDDDSTERNASFAEYDNSFDLQPEYNLSRSDRTHQFVFNTVYNAPFGFQLSSTGRFRSGLPIDVTVSGITGISASAVTLSGSTTGDLNQDLGNFNDRPFSAPGVPFKRNAFRNKPVYNVDFRVQRDFRIGERFKISPSMEIFNIFKFDNIELAGTTVTNYGNPGVNELTGAVLAPTNPNFLLIRNAAGNYLLNNRPGAPLAMQFGIRVAF